MNETLAYLPGLSPVENKELCARFDGGGCRPTVACYCCVESRNGSVLPRISPVV